MKKIWLLFLVFLPIVLYGCGNNKQTINSEEDISYQQSKQEVEDEFAMKEKCHKYNDEWNDFVKEYYGEECGGAVFYNSSYNSCLGEYTCYSVEGPEGRKYSSYNYGFRDVLSYRTLASCQGFDHFYDNDETPPYFNVLDKSLPDYGDMGCGEYFDYLYDYLH